MFTRNVTPFFGKYEEGKSVLTLLFRCGICLGCFAIVIDRRPVRPPSSTADQWEKGRSSPGNTFDPAPSSPAHRVSEISRIAYLTINANVGRNENDSGMDEFLFFEMSYFFVSFMMNWRFKHIREVIVIRKAKKNIEETSESIIKVNLLLYAQFQAMTVEICRANNFE